MLVLSNLFEYIWRKTIKQRKIVQIKWRIMDLNIRRISQLMNEIKNTQKVNTISTNIQDSGVLMNCMNQI